METETGVMLLQAQEQKRTPGAARSWKRQEGPSQSLQRECGPAVPGFGVSDPHGCRGWGSRLLRAGKTPLGQRRACGRGGGL